MVGPCSGDVVNPDQKMFFLKQSTSYTRSVSVLENVTRFVWLECFL